MQLFSGILASHAVRMERQTKFLLVALITSGSIGNGREEHSHDIKWTRRHEKTLVLVIVSKADGRNTPVKEVLF